MSIAQSLLPEFDHEMATMRKTLERVPDSLYGWRPHEKSGTTQWLVSHLVNIPDWLVLSLSTDKLDVQPEGGEGFRTPQQETTAAALAAFDEAVAKGRAALAAADDATLMANWSLLGGGQVYFTMPRVAVVRNMVLNHLIHHRAQLGMYLRLNDVPLPATYGPSADEQVF